MRVTLFLVGVLVAIVYANANTVKSYSGYQVWRLQATNDDQIRKLLDFSHRAHQFNVNFWSEEFRVDLPIDVSIAPEYMDTFKAFLAAEDMQVKYEVIMKDIGSVVDRQRLLNKLTPWNGNLNDFAYNKYHPIDEIHAWIDQMVQAYPTLASSFVVGQSYEKRDMKGLKISSNKKAVKRDGTPVNAKKAVWWDGGIHAREWISPATNIFIVQAFLSNYSKDATITHLVDQFDYYILPVFNVDGYAYTWTNDRLWRKTRSPTSNPSCFGADPNRNWDYQWCEGGATHDPCDDIYCGSKPFSEIETVQVSQFLKAHPEIIHYINFHSYSQLWMSPWGYTTTRPSDFKLQDDGSAKAVAALTAVFGTRYQHGNIGSTIYIASGNTVDWTYGKGNITFSYAVELRDTGEYGFLLPEREIIPTGTETLAGEIALLQYIEGQIYA